MQVDIRTLIGEIGAKMDDFLFPVVLNGGLVMPSRPAGSFSTLGLEKEDAKATRREAPGGSAQRRQAREPSSGTSSESGGGSPGTAASLPLGNDDDEPYPGISKVEHAYPGVQVFRQGKAFWLRLECQLLPEAGRKAVFVVAVMPGIKQVKAWGYWQLGSVGVSWIGPRHTNYPDGSICAFAAEDEVWQYGDSLIPLLDFYTVWAVRHLHLEWLGRWPGPQASSFPVERLIEFKDDEWCGCDNPKGTYGTCCKSEDISKSSPKKAIQFWLSADRSMRHPPPELTMFASTGINPPSLNLL